MFEKCIHGGKMEDCKGQCYESISIETDTFRGILYCLNEKGHDDIHHYEWKTKPTITTESEGKN